MRKVWNLIAAVLAAIFVLTLLDRFVLVQLLAQRLSLPLLFAVLEGTAIAGTGWLARRLQGNLAVNFIVGYPLFGTICFLVGLIHISPAIMLIVVLLFAVAGVLSFLRARQESSADALAGVVKEEAPWHALVVRYFSVLAIAVVLICGLLAAQAPPSSLDELTYHLAIPHSWVVEGRAIDLPLISHSYFPLGIESADLPLLAMLGPVSGGTASHLLHLIAAIAAIVLAWRATNGNLLLTAAIASTPALALTAGWSLVDWPLLGIFLVLADSVRREEDNATVAASIAAGLLTKYTFVPFAIAMLIVNARRWRGAWPGVIVGSVFFIRNLVLTGNPIAPFFSTNAPHVAGYRSLVLASYIFDGRFIDESLGASLLSAAVFTAGGIGLAALILGAALFVLAPSARILVPFFGVAATRGGEAVDRSRLLRVVLAAAVAVQLMLVAYFTDRTQPFALISGKWSEDEYLANVRSSYPAIAWVNQTLPSWSRTLVVGLNETYWFAHPIRGGGNFDGPRISAYIDAATPEALRARLARDGITHVAVFATPPPTAVAQKVAERQTELSKSAQRSLAQMLDTYASNVAAHEGVTLFTLR
jgi:hypothetical protein